MSKRLVCIFVVFFIIIGGSAITHGQFDRVDETQAEIGQQVSTLDWQKNVLRWEKGSNGVWNEYKPKILKTWVHEVSYKDHDYYGLFMYFPDGHYRYPNVRVDWISYKSMAIFIFEKEHLMQLRELDYESIVSLTIPLTKRLTVTLAKETVDSSLSSSITREFLKDSSIDYELEIHIVKLKGSGNEDVIRFVFRDFPGGILGSVSGIRAAKVDMLVDGPYFEASLEDFYSIFPCK